MPSKTILILGASISGLGTAHRMLKAAAKSPNFTRFKIVLVSPSTHLYWNFASPRAIIPGQIKEEQMFASIEDGFKKYNDTQFELVIGTAEDLDTEGKRVTVKVSEGGERNLGYDFLVIATGAQGKEHTPFKSVGSTEATRQHLREYQEKVKNAKTIVVAGAGVTGIEVAGELGAEYGREKEIIVICSSPTVLPSSPTFLSKYATLTLQSLNVAIRPNVKVLSTTTTPSNQTSLSLSTGEPLLADLYIPIFGLTPNSSFIPKAYKNEAGYPIVDTHLNLTPHKDIWAVGDILGIESAQAINSNRQSGYVAKSIVSLLSASNKALAPYKIPSSPFMGLQIGKKAGIGHYGNWRIPTWLVVRLRKDLFTDKLVPAVDGSFY
ncbi:hypothetical protein B0J11DRAFT_576797 [Dendryphion nanum]|uniref:FAD/NAD(P)-binding domain-containing protein n=1 Tax=Dendryphion nanum TaxID=256645 RepID=A0A9P9E6A3_9PLEO|nr:hypothetical protein B0J11DRAFT_576797 [Dendryphion nanum]